MTIQDVVTDPVLRQALKTRAAFMLTLALVAMVAALVAHAGSLDMTIAHPFMQDSGCWCNEYICYCRPD